MTKLQDWQTEARDLKKHEWWSVSGPFQPVKVVPSERRARSEVTGYFTVAQSLFRKTPLQMQVALGLRAGCFKNGATVLGMLRLPQISEYTYELTALYPDGTAFTFLSDRDYPPGDNSIQQWQLRRGVAIRAKILADLKPGQMLQPYWR